MQYFCLISMLQNLHELVTMWSSKSNWSIGYESIWERLFCSRGSKESGELTHSSSLGLSGRYVSSTVQPKLSRTSSCEFLREFENLRGTKNAGIVISWAEPSFCIVILLESSSMLSEIITAWAPLDYRLRTLVTNEQPPRLTSTILLT